MVHTDKTAERTEETEPASAALRLIFRTLREQGILETDSPVIHPLKGTTDGLVYSLSANEEPRYVLKLDRPESIRMTEQWLHTYRHLSLLPKLIYTDPAGTYMVYSFLSGTTHHRRGLKRDWLTRLVRGLFNYYVVCDESMERWGWMESPLDSWHEFIDRGVEESRTYIADLLCLEDYCHVKTLVDYTALGREPGVKLFLHGDTGVHNFVYRQEALIGVIDPSPVAGPVSYDLIYAFCSSPDDLTLDTFMSALAFLQHETAETNRLIAEIAIQLYCRIGICIKHHPYDLKEYLQAWDYWKALSTGSR